MKKYTAFLRAVNVGGKNKIPMADLKKHFIELGFEDAVTYLNSGNVIFSSSLNDKAKITSKIEKMIQEKFNLEIQVLVIDAESLKEIMKARPDWWGTDDFYANLILIFPGTTFEELYAKVGEPKDGLEKIQNYKNAVFWSFDRAKYQKTVWWSKTASAGINNLVTIRTVGTIEKIISLSEK